MTSTTAVSGGNITSDGGVSINARGVCWGSTANPVIADSHTIDGTGDGAFSSIITGIKNNTLYYVRAYATNSVGTSFGNQQSFTIPSTSLLYVSSIVENLTPALIEVNFSLPLANIIPADSSFTVKDSCFPSLSIDITSISISGSKVFLSLYVYSPVIFGHTISLSYNKPAHNPLQTSSGEKVPSFYKQIVNNKVSPLNSEIIFNANVTYGSVGDRDGNTYKTVQIGGQTWMAENLKATKFNDGTEIPYVTDTLKWGQLFINNSPGFCYYDNDPLTYRNTYGALYNFYAVADNRKICPAGWHVPTYDEWKTMITSLGGEDVAGSKLKETGSTHWIKTYSAMINYATNETGFTAIPGGYRSSFGNFVPYFTIGIYGYWWSSTIGSRSYWAWCQYIVNVYTIFRKEDMQGTGFSIRCLKDY